MNRLQGYTGIIGEKFKKVTAVLIGFLAVMAALFSAMTASEAASAASSVYLSKGDSLTYGNYTTHYYTTKGNNGTFYAYCAEPDASVPSTGTYSTSSITMQTNTSINATFSYEFLCAVLYYGYGGPGFDESMWPEENSLGGTMSTMNYYTFTHVLVSYVYSHKLGDALYSVSDNFVEYAYEYLIGYDEDSGTLTFRSDDSTTVLAYIYQHWKNGDVPQSFIDSCFQLNTGSSTQTMMGYDWAGTIEVVFTKTSADATITVNNSAYSLEGAEYEIYDEDGNLVDTFTTDENGQATVTLEPDTTYYLSEVTASEGYEVTSGKQEFTTGSDDSDEVTVEETPMTVDVTINKLSSTSEIVETSVVDGTSADGNDSEYSFIGTTFELYYDADGDGEYDYFNTYTIEEGNTIVLEGLAINSNYYLVETVAPDGFDLNDEPIYFTTGESDSEEDFENDPGYVIFYVYKVDASGEIQEGVSLAGAVFELTDCNGDTHTATSDENGCIEFDDDIPLGAYSIVEVSAPDGYQISDEVLTGTVTADNLSKAQTEDGVNYVTVTAGTIEETPTAFDIQITKTSTDSALDEVTDSGEMTTLEGVEFEVVSNTTGEVVATLTTDEDGYINTADSDWCVWAVESGYIDEDCLYEIGTVSGTTYYGLWFGSGERTEDIQGAFPYDSAGYTIREVEETTPEGYKTADAWTISTDSMVNGVTLKYVVNNAQVTAYLQIVKYDAETGNVVPLSGFSFQLYSEIDSDGNVVESSLITMTDSYQTSTELDTFTTDEDGAVDLPETLACGTYYIVEVESASPYLLSDEVVSFTVEDDDNVAETEEEYSAVVVAFEDEHVHGQATLTKTCAVDGEAIEGAVYSVIAQEDVIGADGTVFYTAGQVIESVTTDENGQATTSLLELGATGSATFAFVETSSPDGYVLDSTPIEFTLSYEDAYTAVVTTSVKTTDQPTVVYPYKTDLDGNTVAGAVFEYWNVEDEIAASDAAIRVDADSVAVSEVVDYCQVIFDVPDGWTVILIAEEDGSTYIYNGEDMEIPAGTYTASVYDADGADVLNDDLTAELEAGIIYTVSGTDAVLLFSASASMDESGTIDTSVEVTYNEDEDFWDVSGLKNGSTYTVTVDGEIVGTFTYEGETLYFTVSDSELVSEAILLIPDATVYEVELDEDGAAAIYHLTSGTYHMVEISVPTGYLIDSTIWTFTIDEDGYATATEVYQYYISDMGDIDGGWYTAAQISQLGADSSVYESLTISSSDGTWVLTGTATDGTTLTLIFADDEVRDVNTTVEADIEDYACILVVADDVIKLEVSKYDVTGGTEVEGAELVITDTDGNVLYEWTSTTEPYRIEGIEPGDYILYEYMTPHTYDQATAVEFTVTETGVVQTVVMVDEPITISGDIDKKQEIADPTAAYTEENGDGENTASVSVSETGSYDYTLDYENTSSTWVDEFTVTDYLECAEDGLAYLTGITTAQAYEDYDGLMNVWYMTNLTAEDYVDESGANATLSDGHENSWLSDETVVAAIGDDARVLDYTGWVLWAEDVSTTTSTYLSVDDLDLEEGEYVIAFRFEYGRVEEGFTTRTDGWDAETRYDVHDDIDDADTYTVSVSESVTVADTEDDTEDDTADNTVSTISELGSQFYWDGAWVSYDELMASVEDGTLSCEDGVYTLTYDPETTYKSVTTEDGSYTYSVATTTYSTYTFADDEVSNPEVSVSYTIDGETWETIEAQDMADTYLTKNEDGTYTLQINIYDSSCIGFSYTDSDGEEQLFSVGFTGYRSFSEISFPYYVESVGFYLTYEDGVWSATDEDGNTYELTLETAVGAFGVYVIYNYTLEADQVTGMDGLSAVYALDGCIVSIAEESDAEDTEDSTSDSTTSDSIQFVLDEDNSFGAAAGTYTVSSLIEALGADGGYIRYDEETDTYYVAISYSASGEYVVFTFDEDDETYGIEAGVEYTLETFAEATGLEDAVYSDGVITGTIDGESVSFTPDSVSYEPWFTSSISQISVTIVLNDSSTSTSSTSSDFSYASAIIHMQVTDDYVEGTVLANEAQVDLYRNGGNTSDDEGLEDHDKDRVEQTPKTVYPEVETTLTDTDGDHYVTNEEEVTLVDTVTYSGIEVGVEHILYGTLMDAETGEAVVDADGNTVTSSIAFIPDSTDGSIEVTFTFNASDLGGHDVVAFEELVLVETIETTDEETGEVVTTLVETPVAEHKDLTDEGQTVHIISETIVQTGTSIVAVATMLVIAGSAILSMTLRNRRKFLV